MKKSDKMSQRSKKNDKLVTCEREWQKSHKLLKKVIKCKNLVKKGIKFSEKGQKMWQITKETLEKENN